MCIDGGWHSREVGDANGHGHIGELGRPLQSDILVNQQHVGVVTHQQVGRAISH